jgi:hypothetical protein
MITEDRWEGYGWDEHSDCYESPPFFEKVRIIKKTRKEHVCKETKTVIPVGSEALYYVVCSGQMGFEYWYTHSEATLRKMYDEAPKLEWAGCGFCVNCVGSGSGTSNPDICLKTGEPMLKEASK